MKISELVANQKISIQLLWGERKIEFSSNVIENSSEGAYITPYLHNGSVLEIDISPGKGVLCNVFTGNPINKQRVSWKNVELKTVELNNETVYLIKTNGFNQIAMQDDRRLHDRIVVHIRAQVFDATAKTGSDIIIHDISDIGISFYAPLSYELQSSQMVITFVGVIDDKEFNVKVECSVTRTEKKAGNQFFGCKVNSGNKDYQLYCFMLRLHDKSDRK